MTTCKYCGQEFEWPAWGEFSHFVILFTAPDTGVEHGVKRKRFAPTCPHCNFPIYQGDIDLPKEAIEA